MATSFADSETFSAVFDEFWAPLWRYSTVITGDPELSKEVISDYFAYVWERRNEIVVRGSLNSYLFGAVRNLSINAVRDTRRAGARLDSLREYLTHEQDEPETEQDDSTPDANTNAHLPDVRTMLATLSPRYREVIQLRWLQGLSAEEIAHVMGISVDATFKLMQRALKKLRSAAQAQVRP